MSFSAEIDSWVKKAKGRQEAIFKTALERTIEDAQTPRGEGGRMRVDTGFLRNSLVGATNRRPLGPSDAKTDQQGRPSDATLVITLAEPSDTIYIGWAANYARVRENADGFLEAAAQKWPKQVREATAEAKRRIR